MSPGKASDSFPSQALAIKSRKNLFITGSCVLPHVLIEHRQHNEREQRQPGQKDHQRLQIPTEDFERTVIHGSGLSDASIFSFIFSDSDLLCSNFARKRARQS